MSFAGGYRPSTGGANTATNMNLLNAARSSAQAPDGLTLGQDFPMVCEVCLGDNPYVRMQKIPMGSACKITDRPFNVFRWKAGRGGRYKSTIICYEVAAEKNLCQACLVDMQYGLPAAVRDAFLQGAAEDAGDKDLDVPSTEINQAYYYNQVLAKQGQEGFEHGAAGKAPTQTLLKLARQFTKPYSQQNKTQFRNLPKLCSFWLAGLCTRVLEGKCPFRPCCGAFVFPELASNHPNLNRGLIEDLKNRGAVEVMRSLDEETRQALKDALKGNRDVSIRNRYYGKDDELSKKYIARGKEWAEKMKPPEDDSVTTLFVSGLPHGATEADLRDVFYAHGEIVRTFFCPTAPPPLTANCLPCATPPRSYDAILCP